MEVSRQTVRRENCLTTADISPATELQTQAKDRSSAMLRDENGIHHLRKNAKTGQMT